MLPQFSTCVPLALSHTCIIYLGTSLRPFVGRRNNTSIVSFTLLGMQSKRLVFPLASNNAFTYSPSSFHPAARRGKQVWWWGRVFWPIATPPSRRVFLPQGGGGGRSKTAAAEERARATGKAKQQLLFDVDCRVKITF